MLPVMNCVGPPRPPPPEGGPTREGGGLDGGGTIVMNDDLFHFTQSLSSFTPSYYLFFLNSAVVLKKSKR